MGTAVSTARTWKCTDAATSVDNDRDALWWRAHEQVDKIVSVVVYVAVEACRLDMANWVIKTTAMAYQKSQQHSSAAKGQRSPA